MFENLALLYRHHGGLREILTAPYFWSAAIFACIALFLGPSGAWASIALATLPSLAGFSIASFALIFSVIDKDTFSALAPKDKTGKSPLLQTVAIFVHVVCIQAVTLLISAFPKMESVGVWGYVSDAATARVPHISSTFYLYAPWVTTFFGYLLVFYSLIMVVALALSAFRLIVILAEIRTR